MKASSFTSFDAEVQLADDLKHHGRRIFDGSTNAHERMQRSRAAIIVANLAERVIARTADTNPETFAQAFARVYREPLIPNEPPEPEEEFA